MRYFTRDLYQSIQGDDDEADDAWEKAREAYGEHFERIRGDLPASAQAATGRSWHDAVITAVHTSPDGKVEVVLDGQYCPWPEGEIRIVLTGVVESEIPEAPIGDTWLYKEWNSVGPDTFELSVLMQGSELRFVASDIAVTVGEYPVRILADHACSANPPPRRIRIVRVEDTEADSIRWVISDEGLGLEEEGDRTIVRNIRHTVEVGFCPFCGLKLAEPQESR